MCIRGTMVKRFIILNPFEIWFYYINEGEWVKFNVNEITFYTERLLKLKLSNFYDIEWCFYYIGLYCKKLHIFSFFNKFIFTDLYTKIASSRYTYNLHPSRPKHSKQILQKISSNTEGATKYHPRSFDRSFVPNWITANTNIRGKGRTSYYSFTSVT